MKPWLRYHTATLDNRKVQALPAVLFRHWVNTMCIASEYDQDGLLPRLADYAFRLRVSQNKATGIRDDLLRQKLLDKDGEGRYRVHDWRQWQYTSDVSTERVRRFRKRQSETLRNVSETPPDTETEQKQNRGTPPISPPAQGNSFEEWVQARIDDHPNPNDATLGIRYLTETSLPSSLEELHLFENIHHAWCEYWRQDRNGKFAPKFPAFVLDYEKVYRRRKPPEAKKTEAKNLW